jgi:uncharacterized iron-regulated membrane protein
MIRKALFQIHLWAGIGVGLYIFMICVTGSFLVFRVEFYNHFRPGTTVAARSTPRLTQAELTAAAIRAYPAMTVVRVVIRRRSPTTGAEVWLEGGGQERHRLLDPYTGADLGDADPHATEVFEKIVDLHDNLLGGMTGRAINGVGGVFLAVLCLTGAVIWWPGRKHWRRAMTVRWKSGWKRFNWDLHSAMGFWALAFIFMWAVTGIYMVFPQPFNALNDFIEPFNPAVAVRRGDIVLEWLAKLHFGRFAGMKVKLLWAAAGLVPPALFVTGAVMWWNRVLRGWLHAGDSAADRVRRQAYTNSLKAFFR